MALVNFYKGSPADAEAASDIEDGRMVVFTNTRPGARELAARVRALGEVDIIVHEENSGPGWTGSDYFVMVGVEANYGGVRERLRPQVARWAAAGYPYQTKSV